MRLHLCFFLAALTLMLSGCVQSEPLNAECDIIEASLPADYLNRQPVIQNDKVLFIVKSDVNITALAPTFELTPGAVIEPASGTVRNFTTPQEYTVTSEDGKWHKVYTVEVQSNSTINLNYSFEHVRLQNNYDVFYEIGPTGNETMAWASGNAGFAMSGVAKAPDEFPTFQITEGRIGKCAALVTRSTGSFGVGVKKPIAAGNLYIGTFNTLSAITSPLKATRFGAGATFMNEPLYFKGWYTYKPGDVFTILNENGKPEEAPGRIDKFNIYAVLFETTPGVEWLDGTNVLAADNPNIVAVAEIGDDKRVRTPEWTEFFIPFVYRRAIDPVKMAAGRYSLTIVCSSSIDGDLFEGAVGSRLCIDELSLVCKSDEDNNN